jgi:hypothetical protein
MARGPGKGKTNNPKGRPPGPNKVTQELKQFYTDLLAGEKENIKKALRELEKDDPHKYLMAIDKISNKVIANKKDITSDDKPLANVSIIENRDKSE